MTGWFQVFPFDQRREPRELLVPFRRRVHEHDVAVFGQHDQMIAGEHDLAVAVAAALPVLLTGLGVHAREDRFVEPVDGPLCSTELVNLFFIRWFSQTVFA